jgi:serine/threonine protein kinase/tetratricopeptide (TPR) repeat protein
MTDPDRWRQVEEIFHQALERPESERTSWLDFTCGDDAELRAEVGSLIESDRAAAGAFVGSKIERAVMQLNEERQPTVEGRRLGPYRLLRELGRGGMGAVYLAARDDQQYESEVAIKLVRPGLDTDFILRRFRRERQILARLQHSNIARMFDGGTTEDGIPYLVMEYVKGSWITNYAAEYRLSVEARLRLFLPVCDAVEHAHRNFIIHRDLKPANILIDPTGAPKLLDFGVSKLLHSEQSDPSETQGVSMMTPDYASPEQMLGEPVGVASDVYSLGAVLYELLTGVRPHKIKKCTPLALERAICQEETIAPSLAVRGDRRLYRRIAGDLDNIILRAMQKQPERRYLTAGQMADDIRRHLDHRPVEARPISFTYRTARFVRRNRVVVTLGSLMAASLIGGAAVAIREARTARERFEQVRKLATTFVFDVEEASHNLPGSTRLRQLIARTGLEYLDNLARSSARDWDLKRELATAYMRIAEVHGGTDSANLGDPAAALVGYRRAEALLSEVLQHKPADRAAAQERLTLLFRMGNLQRHTGQMEQALASTAEGTRITEALLAQRPEDIELTQYAAVFHLDMARMRQQTGELNVAADEVASGIRLLERVAAARPDQRETRANIAASHARLGGVLAELGRRKEALASYRNGVDELESMVRQSPNDTRARHELMLAYSHVGDILGNPAYDNFGDTPGARAAYIKMAEMARALHDADPADVRAISDYGIALLRLGSVIPLDQKQDKQATLQKSHELLAGAAHRNPKDRANGMHKAWNEVQLGDLFRAVNDASFAVRYYQMALASAETTLAIDPKDSGTQRWLVAAARSLAEHEARSDDRVQALATLDKAVVLAQRVEATAPPGSLAYGLVIARAWTAAGSVHKLLAAREKGDQRDRDLQAARNGYQRSVESWRKLESHRGFHAGHLAEMNAAKDALTGLRVPSTRTENSR